MRREIGEDSSEICHSKRNEQPCVELEIKKKLKNRESAKKFRNKKKMEQNWLEQEVVELKKELYHLKQIYNNNKSIAMFKVRDLAVL